LRVSRKSRKSRISAFAANAVLSRKSRIFLKKCGFGNAWVRNGGFMIEEFMQKAMPGDTLVYYVGNYSCDIARMSRDEKSAAFQKMRAAQFYAKRGLGILTQRVYERTKKGSIFMYQITRAKKVDPDFTWWRGHPH
jgi:hypothetical protein